MGPCLKPVSALDLLLHSRKGPYQSLMSRGDIRIRRVPTPLAYALAEALEEKIEIDGIYFAGRADKDAPQWHVFDIRKKGGEINPDLKDVCLRFAPKSGLKFLAEHALGLTPKFHFKDVEVDRQFLPKELGYAPYALAISNPAKNWEVYGKNKKGERIVIGKSWPGVIKHHIDHWATRPDAREYASDDIVYTRGLDDHFKNPEPGDDDSILACMVPVIRWRGFTINIKGMAKLLAKAREHVRSSPVNVNKPPEVRRYIGECMDDMEAMFLEETTKKAKLQAVAAWEIKEPEECTKCDGNGCVRCNGTGALKVGKHPAAVRAQLLLDVKIAKKEIELYTKLLRAKKFHASFNVIGTLSTRMSGTDGLNAQGIKATKEVRGMFPLAWEGYDLCGGDFDSFEVTLADAVYNDPKLREALVTRLPCHKCDATGVTKCKKCAKKVVKGGVPDPACTECKGEFLLQGEICEECEGTKKTTKKIHALFAMALFPGKTYDEIIASAALDGVAQDVALLDRPVENPHDRPDAAVLVIVAALQRVEPFRNMERLDLVEGQARADVGLKRVEKSPVPHVACLRPVALNPGQELPDQVDDFRLGRRRLTIAHQGVILLPRFGFVISEVDLLLADLDVPSLGLFPEERLRLFHNASPEKVQ